MSQGNEMIDREVFFIVIPSKKQRRNDRSKLSQFLKLLLFFIVVQLQFYAFPPTYPALPTSLTPVLLSICPL